MIQSLSLSYILFSISSSSSLIISGVIAFAIRLFYDFPFNASTSAFLTISRISFILKTNLLKIATRFPFLRSLRTYNSSLASVSSFHKRAFLEVVLSKATLDYSIYYFIGVLRVDKRIIILTSNVASCSSVPSSSELSSREWSRLFRVIRGSRIT